MRSGIASEIFCSYYSSDGTIVCEGGGRRVGRGHF